MNVFDDYAHYYDLLYKDKDYRAEAEYIDSLIKKNLPDARTILDLGCGTGNHDHILAGKDYAVTGVDCSSTNLTIAQSKLDNSGLQSNNLKFVEGDVRSVRLDKAFDVVIMLFHVMSYQTCNEDFIASIHTAKSHLKKGGLFIFDCWYGPAVLTDPPEVRIKSVEDSKIKVIRIAEPEMMPNKNVVKVNYKIIVQKKDTKGLKEVIETHRMRYFFMPEVEFILKEVGFKSISCTEWMSERAPGCDTWCVNFINSHI